MGKDVAWGHTAWWMAPKWESHPPLVPAAFSSSPGTLPKPAATHSAFPPSPPLWLWLRPGAWFQSDETQLLRSHRPLCSGCNFARHHPTPPPQQTGEAARPLAPVWEKCEDEMSRRDHFKPGQGNCILQTISWPSTGLGDTQTHNAALCSRHAFTRHPT